MPKGLGRGLQALFPNEEQDVDLEQVQRVPIKELRANPYQPRSSFHDETIEELSQSIREHGIVQPLIVRQGIKGYDIVAGERRFRAAKRLDMKQVPVIVKELSDEDMMEIALIENLQREDLNPLEEAIAYKKLIEQLGMTQEKLGQRVGKSRPYIANHMRLLQLPSGVQELIRERKLSMGHGRALLGMHLKEHIQEAAAIVIRDELNVRNTEKLVQEFNERGTMNNPPEKEQKKPFHIEKTERELQTYFGTSVTIKKGKHKGKIEIEFLTDDDLSRILSLLGEETD
ncbi:ParB/RepB/Spo0J family partition protein [Geomicrobium sediminis]|uniref:ParB family chromosome partitioning protein n=1 Tax=Geomicrobium sediminis TaxID=1347788 RepID=A0ABS2PHF0_9BACL|nr:ParB family chromosome partitioning protein [Geomicrobium sediminis]